MRIALVLLVACSTRSLPAVSEATPPPPPVILTPNAPRVSGEGLVTCQTTFTLTLLEDPCSGNTTDCGFQLRGVRGPARDVTESDARDYYDDWTDCGTALPPRSNNSSGSTDLQDAACTFTADGTVTFSLTLFENEVNRISVRTRDAAGNVSSEDFVEIEQDSIVPMSPKNVQVIAAANQVIVSWDEPAQTIERNQDIQGYRIYYGTQDPGRGTPDLNKLDGLLSSAGPSPVDVPFGTKSFVLTDIPNGTPIYVAVTVVDSAFEQDAANCAAHEVPPAGFDIRKQFAVPGEFSLSFINEAKLPANVAARAVVANGDLIVVAAADVTSPDSPQTQVFTYDLKDLADFGASPAPLGSLLNLPKAAGRSACKYGKVPGEGTLAAAPMEAIFHDRYVFIANGVGSVYAVDVADPKAPVNAWVGSSDSAAGCAYGLDLYWPWLIVADGFPSDVGAYATNDGPGRVYFKKLAVDPNEKLTSDDLCENTADTFSLFDTARDVAFVRPPDNTGRGALYVLSQNERQGGDQANVSRMVRLSATCSEAPFADLQLPENDGECGAALYCNPPGQEQVDISTRLFVEPPLLITARDTTQNLGQLSVYDMVQQPQDPNIDSGVFPPHRIELQQSVFAIASAGKYIFVGEEGNRGIDVIDVSGDAPTLVGTYEVPGTVRGLSVSGSYLVAVVDTGTDSRVIVFALHQPKVVANAGAKKSLAVPNVRGTRSWVSEPSLRNDPGENLFFMQSLRSLAYQPIGASGGGAVNNYCFLQNESGGALGCNERQLNTPAFGSKACFVPGGGLSPRWPAICVPDAITSVSTLNLAGPDLMFTFDGPGGTLQLMSRGIDASGGLFQFTSPSTLTLTGTSKPPDGTSMRAVPGYAAFSSPEGAVVIDRRNRQAPVQADLPAAMLADLRGAHLTLSELCGVRFSGDDPRSAELVCYDLAPPHLESHVPLGVVHPTTNEAIVEKHGHLAVVSIVTKPSSKTDGVYVVSTARMRCTDDPDIELTSNCAGMPIPDHFAVSADAKQYILEDVTYSVADGVVTATSAERSVFPLQTTYPSIQVEGPFVYVACELGMCQLSLRRK